MEQFKIFDNYQKKSLLPSLGSSDEIYTKLLAAADDILEMLKKTPVKISKYTLVALDNTIVETEPVLEEVENIISGKWQMLRSHFENMPISLYRAVILEALSKLVIQNVKFASAVWLTAIDVYPLLSVPNKEQAVLNDFFDKLSDHVEDSAIADWKISNDNIEVKIPKFDVKLATTKTEIDVTEMSDEMIAAAAPHGADGVARTNPNPHWPNQYQAWTHHFGPRAGSGIASIVNQALDEQSGNLNKNVEAVQAALNGYFSDLGKNIKTALVDASKSTVAVERRSQLLWWKETLYSKSQHKSYRKLNAFESTIAMAHDLYYLLPALSPISVDYILKEAFSQIYGIEKKEIKLIDFLNEVANSKQHEFLEKYLENQTVDPGRTDLVSYMNKIVFSKIEVKKDMVLSLGVKPDTFVSYEELSLWILHSLCANHLLTIPK